MFFVAEVVGGVVSNSLALLADAGHMFTDVGALALSLFVAWFSRQPAAPEKTYGYLRWEILAALLNGAVLLLVSGLIVWEAIGRLQSPEELRGGIMLAVAFGGLLVNAASAAILRPVHSHSLNARGADVRRCARKGRSPRSYSWDRQCRGPRYRVPSRDPGSSAERGDRA